MARITLCSLGLACALIAGCATEPGDDPNAPVPIGQSAVVLLATSRQFVADFPGVAPEDVSWYFPGGPEYGTIDQDGLLTAKVTAGTFLVIAIPDYTTGVAPDTSEVLFKNLKPTTSLGFGAYSIDVSSTGAIAGVDGLDTLWIREGADSRAYYFPGWPVSVAFSPSGQDLYIAMLTGRVIRIDVATGTAEDTLDLGSEALHVKVRASTGVVYATDASGKVHRVDPATMTSMGSVTLASPSSGLSFGANGGTLWATATESGVLYRLDPATLGKLDSLVLGNGVQRLRAMVSGDSVYIAHQTKDTLFILRPSTMTLTGVAVCCGPQGVAISPDGKRLYVAQVQGGVTVLERSTMRILGGIATGTATRDVTVEPATGAILAAAEANAVRID